MDLNTIVTDYKISREGGVGELRLLQERLHDVPVSLKKAKTLLEASGFTFSNLTVQRSFSTQ